MKFSANRLAFIVGAFILALMAIDGLIQLNREAFSGFGFGQNTQVQAGSTAALFMLGIVGGMIIGIGLFFGYLTWRGKRNSEQPDEIEALLEEIAREEEEDENPLFVEDNQMEEPIESLDPWERPSDWWKQSDGI
tara:strand:+ start:1162 stop:1566 length:405 start_codon:yes stop_codon:yes gene_type:complete